MLQNGHDISSSQQFANVKNYKVENLERARDLFEWSCKLSNDVYVYIKNTHTHTHQINREKEKQKKNTKHMHVVCIKYIEKILFMINHDIFTEFTIIYTLLCRSPFILSLSSSHHHHTCHYSVRIRTQLTLPIERSKLNQQQQQKPD